MSLRAFHLVFIVLSALLAVFLAAWATEQYSARHEVGYALAGLVSLVVAGGLSAYATAFWRKTKHL
jgi:hypothetical protein